MDPRQSLDSVGAATVQPAGLRLAERDADGGQDVRPGHARDRLKSKPPKLYRIGEVVDYSGLSRQSIHNYTIMGLIHESKWTTGGHRLYDETVFERLDLIASLRKANKSLQEIREQLSL